MNSVELRDDSVFSQPVTEIAAREELPFRHIPHRQESHSHLEISIRARKISLLPFGHVRRVVAALAYRLGVRLGVRVGRDLRAKVSNYYFKVMESSPLAFCYNEVR